MYNTITSIYLINCKLVYQLQATILVIRMHICLPMCHKEFGPLQEESKVF